MKVLWVYAHPEERSLSATLRDVGTAAVRAAGHDLEVSDLYALSWKASLDRDDIGDLADPPTEISRATKHAQQAGTLSDDIRTEQAKLLAADAVVLQFPLWWYSVPAILKGWIDRVFAKGFAYGISDPEHPGRTLRYGDGPLRGRQAQVITTIGSPEPAMGPRGINGQLDQVLFPLLHGTLWYVGMDVLPPLAIHGADRIEVSDRDRAANKVRERIAQMWDVDPIRYRFQNRGDYDDDLVLDPTIATGRSGLDVHIDREPGRNSHT